MLLNHKSCREYLLAELERRVQTNSRYTLRAFARHLSLSPGELSEVLRGKRALGTRALTRVGQALGLNATESRHLTVLAQMDKELKSGEKSPLKLDSSFLGELQPELRLSEERFAVVAEWYHSAILNLSEIQGFRWDERWISRRLGIGISQATLAIKRLERLGLLKKKPKGGYEKQDSYFTAGGEAPSAAVRKFHRQMLELALKALDFQKMEEREIAGATLSIAQSNLPYIKKDISDFLDQLVAKYGARGKKDTVYHLELAFFRLMERESHGG